MNKSKRKGGNRGNRINKPRRFNPLKGLFSRVYFGRRGNWQSLGDAKIGSRRASHNPEKDDNTSASANLEGFYGQEKTSTQPPLGLQKPQLALVTESSRLSGQQPSRSESPLDGQVLYSAVNETSPVSAISSVTYTHQPQDSFSSTNPVQFGSLTGTGTVSTNTLRSRMGPDVFYNQSEMAREPSRAYDPRQGKVNRASQLSSISSGFGDGDIVVPGQFIPPVPLPPTNVDAAGTTAIVAAATSNINNTAQQVPSNGNNYGGARFSWMSQSQKSKRDTIYTETSEDSPPRFRTLASWVDQQTGRIKRAQQRQGQSPIGSQAMGQTGFAAPPPPVPQLPPGQLGVPGVHNPPNEQSFNMMMDDERPRPVEDAMMTMRGFISANNMAATGNGMSSVPPPPRDMR